MGDEGFDTFDVGDAPTIEVRVFRHGELVHRALCESEEQAKLVSDQWAELEGVQVQVDDLTVQHEPDQILAPGEAVLGDDDYPAEVGGDERTWVE